MLSSISYRFAIAALIGASYIAGAVVPTVSRAGEATSKSTAVEPEAEQILRSMSNHLKGLKMFTFSFDSDVELITHDGEKLQVSSSGTVEVERPVKIHAVRKGSVADAAFTYDGKTLTILERKSKAYAQFDVPGSLDDALDTARDVTGFSLAGADLLYGDVYPGLTLEIRSGRYIGTAMVNGVECHHLAYRAREIDWQLWVSTGDKPLPMKYVITSKLMAAAPQFSVRLRDWNTEPNIDAKTFVFTPPADARKVDSIAVTETGDSEVQQ